MYACSIYTNNKIPKTIKLKWIVNLPEVHCPSEINCSSIPFSPDPVKLFLSHKRPHTGKSLKWVKEYFLFSQSRLFCMHISLWLFFLSLRDVRCASAVCCGLFYPGSYYSNQLSVFFIVPLATMWRWGSSDPRNLARIWMFCKFWQNQIGYKNYSEM